MDLLIYHSLLPPDGQSMKTTKINPLAGPISKIYGAACSGEFETALSWAAALAGAFPVAAHANQVYSEMLFLTGRYGEAEKRAAAVSAIMPQDDYVRGLLYRISRAKAPLRPWLGIKTSGWPEPSETSIVTFPDKYVEAFNKLFSKGNYLRAFKLGEALLNIRLPQDHQVIHALNYPLGCDAVYDPKLGAYHMSRLAVEHIPKRYAVWKEYYLEFLYGWDDGKKRSIAKIRSRREFPLLVKKDRYGWMLVKYASRHLFKASPPRYIAAAKLLEAALTSVPYSWEALCRLGEIELCRGRTSSAMSRFEHALNDLPRSFRCQALTWRGEMYLFLGNYRAALEDLEAGEAGGASYAACWRACALMKLGKLQKALSIVSAYIPANPRDMEALVIKGEILRLMGRNSEALRPLDAAISGDFPYKVDARWAYLNRALILLDMGQIRAASKSVSAVPRSYLEYASKFIYLPGRHDALSGSEIRMMAEFLLDKAKGLRRDEEYLDPLWMKPWK